MGVTTGQELAASPQWELGGRQERRETAREMGIGHSHFKRGGPFTNVTFFDVYNLTGENCSHFTGEGNESQRV